MELWLSFHECEKRYGKNSQQDEVVHVWKWKTVTRKSVYQEKFLFCASNMMFVFPLFLCFVFKKKKT